MDIKAFSEKFNSDPVLQTAFASTLARRIQTSGLSETKSVVEIAGDQNGNVNSLVVGRKNDDLNSHLVVADVALQSLKEHGVTDMTGIGVIRGASDPAALTVVYKGGGWVVSTRGINEFKKDTLSKTKNI